MLAVGIFEKQKEFFSIIDREDRNRICHAKRIAFGSRRTFATLDEFLEEIKAEHGRLEEAGKVPKDIADIAFKVIVDNAHKKGLGTE